MKFYTNITLANLILFFPHYLIIIFDISPNQLEINFIIYEN